MGIEKIIITNAAGGINTDYCNGDFVLISDHIKFFNEGPLTGEDASILGGNRFFDMSDTYCEYLRNRVAGAFETETGIRILIASAKQISYYRSFGRTNSQCRVS